MQRYLLLQPLLAAILSLCISPMVNAADVKGAINPGNTLPPDKPIANISNSFTDYVESCKRELGFDSIPQMDCRDVNFRPFTGQVNDYGDDFSRTNDWVAHARINDNVDALFACRWVQNNSGVSTTASAELLVHNRVKGGTCFFQLKPVDDPFTKVANGTGAQIFKKDNGSSFVHVGTTNPPSPTSFGADRFWDAPEENSFFGISNTRNLCTRCHSAGPYIASPEIVGALAKYGLINDGHDTAATRYNAVGTVFGPTFNQYIAKTLQKPSSSTAVCASQCHVVGGNSAILDTNFTPDDSTGAILMLPIDKVIAEEIASGEMKPDDPYSDYRWINRDDPRYSGDFERLSDVKKEYPQFYCKSPSYMQAHEVDDGDVVYETGLFIDTIDTFNLQEGLICMNADQPGGVCTNYEVRYRCGGKWRDWQSHDRPNGSGDFERRSSYVFPDACKDSPPTRIQARYYIDGFAQVVDGPPDRLYQFDQNGLVCRNEDQPSGEPCHNYTVRFICN